MSKEKPQVSILMPAYNAERFLAEAIESILSQSFEDFEFLIMDDGSTDSTWEILQSYAQKDERIKLFQQENKGVAVTLNFLFSVAKGEFIARMDADDISLPERLQQEVNYLMQHPEVGMVSTGRLRIAPNGLPHEIAYPPNDQKVLADLFDKGINPITHGSVMMRKSVLMQLNEMPYREQREKDSEGCYEDFYLWKSLIKITTLATIESPLYSFRLHNSSLTHKLDNKSKQISSNLINKFGSLLEDESGYECFLNGRALFLNGYPIQAIKNLIQASVFGKDLKYKFGSLAFIGLVILGPIGKFIYRRLKDYLSSKNQWPKQSL